MSDDKNIKIYVNNSTEPTEEVSDFSIRASGNNMTVMTNKCIYNCSSITKVGDTILLDTINKRPDGLLFGRVYGCRPGDKDYYANWEDDDELTYWEDE